MEFNDLPFIIINGRYKRGTWENKENHKRYAEWLFNKKEFKSMEDWYKIQLNDFSKYKGKNGLLKIYNGSYSLFLKNVYPDYLWYEWLFLQCPNNFWDDINNHKRYAKWLYNKKEFKSMEDWYKIQINDFKINKGAGLLVSKYNGSHSLFLKNVYPDYLWYEWLFLQCPNNFWDDKNNHKRYVEWLYVELKYKSMTDWYNITYNIIKEKNGNQLLVNYYNHRYILLLQNIYPDYSWDISKFRKQYSYGQIEWLQYLITETPDIIHILNDDNGEYKIPNSNYKADGFSKEKNTVYEYHGDFWHGNPMIYNNNNINPVTNNSFGELYQNTIKKKVYCENIGFNYIFIWESDWIRGKNAVKKIQMIFKNKTKF